MKKIIIIMLFLVCIFSVRNVDAASNRIYYQGTITSNQLNDFSCIKISVFIIDEKTEYDDFTLTYENEIRTISVKKDGTFSFFGEDKEYLIKIKEDTLPDFFFCSNLYSTLNSSNIFCSFKLEYNESYQQVINVESNESCLIEETLNEEDVVSYNNINNNLHSDITSKPNKISFNDNNGNVRFIVCYDEVDEEDENFYEMVATTVANELFNIENYFVSIRNFLKPYTVNDIYYVIVEDLYRYSGLCIYNTATNGSFIKIDIDLFDPNASQYYSSYYVSTIVHEYFHSIQKRYYYGASVAKYGLLNEATATFAGFKYINDLTNISNENKCKFISGYDDYYNIFYNPNIYSIHEQNQIDRKNFVDNKYSFYYFFVYFYQICENESINGWEGIKSILLNVDEDNENPFELAIEVTYYSILEEEKTYDEIFEDFIIFTLDFSQNININENYLSLFVNPFTESNQYLQNEQLTYIMQNNSIGYKRVDAYNYSYGMLKFKIDLGDSSDNHNNLKVYVKTVRQNDTFSINQIQLNPNDSITTISTLIGIDSIKYIEIIMIYFGANTINVGTDFTIDYRPYRDTRYKLSLCDETSKKYMTVELDEFGCITIDKNIYLFDNLNNNSQYFWIRQYSGNNYYIECDATSLYPDEFDDFILYANNQNIQINCYDSMPNMMFFNFNKVSDSTYRIYVSGYTSQIIQATSFSNGSNSNNDILSNGNVILNTSQNTILEKWRLYPTE